MGIQAISTHREEEGFLVDSFKCYTNLFDAMNILLRHVNRACYNSGPYSDSACSEHKQTGMRPSDNLLPTAYL